jgi:hypothetical protein
MCKEFEIESAQISRWVQEGKFPRPWSRGKNRKPLWAPETLQAALIHHRHLASQ